ncbi:MAG TPA: helix-turn-helix domain-containing protein [Mycobacterium sp.]|nr:helix-turn-helix domain-containing protein [Mycobacterium sp.]HTX96334.1 helix-turn-helix domain-containing protein [Mycobacterium sp.]
MLDDGNGQPLHTGAWCALDPKGRNVSRSAIPILNADPKPRERRKSYNRRPDNSRLLSTQQASAYLGISPNTLRKYVADGGLKAYRLGEKLLKYDPADLNEFLQSKVENA